MTRTLVTEVLRTEFALTHELQPKLMLAAWGEVPTTGWKNGKLEPRATGQPDAQGLIEADFTAEKPTGLVSQVLSAIPASLILSAEAKRVRIHTAAAQPYEVTVPQGTGGSVSLPLSSAPNRRGSAHGFLPRVSVPAGGGSDYWPWGEGHIGPWPWRSALDAPTTLPDLIGMTIRVLGPGEVGTTDWNPNRVTFFVDAKRAILDIKVG